MTTYPYRGKTHTLPAIATMTGVPVTTLKSRLNRGIPPAVAFAMPIAAKHRPVRRSASPTSPSPPPRLEPHHSGRARVRWSEFGHARQANIGPWPVGDAEPPPETVAAYNRWCSEWYASRGRVAPAAGEAVTVGGLVVRFLSFAADYYVKNGRPTSQIHGYRSALALLNERYGTTAASAFTVARLRVLQAEWVRMGRSLNTANKYVGLVARCFAWGVGQDLIPAAVADSLPHLERLEPGRTVAPVAVPITAADDAAVEATIPHLHPDPGRCAVLAAMVRLGRTSGMRPGELCELRPEDVDRSREPWRYEPASGGKTLHKGRQRRIWLGPKARAVLGPWLIAAEAGRPVFRLPPRLLADGKSRRSAPPVPVSGQFFCRRVAEACKAAGVAPWSPNQLRHARATEIHERYEDDAAVAAVLGNSPEVSRQVYVDGPADAVAKRVAEMTG